MVLDLSQISAGMSSGPSDEPQLALPSPPVDEQPPAATVSMIWLTAWRPLRKSPIDTNAVLLMTRAFVA